MDPQKILIANGVNLDLLGQREPKFYGKTTLKELESLLSEYNDKLSKLFNKEVNLCFFQTNIESEYLEIISKPWSAAILNPGAWTHTSLALADRLAATKLKFIEVHLSDISQRKEKIRKTSLISPCALGSIQGLGPDSYLGALLIILKRLELS